eukprot:7617438-Karenia_brevis.AAC.1
MACTMDTWLANGASLHAAHLLQATQQYSWFTIEGLAGAMVFEDGTTAGTPMADIIFIAAMARVLSCLDAELESAGMIHNLNTEGANSYFGLAESGRGAIGPCTPLSQASYMDDCASRCACFAAG